jgi:hypothetical protein
MLADLDLLLTVVYCTADNFLPGPPGNARRKITDAEIVTLCPAQAIMGIPSDYRFVAVAGKRLRHLFPAIPTRDALHKRRIRLSAQMEALIAHFARQSPETQGEHAESIRRTTNRVKRSGGSTQGAVRIFTTGEGAGPPSRCSISLRATRGTRGPSSESERRTHGNHGRATAVDGVDDLGVVDALQGME